MKPAPPRAALPRWIARLRLLDSASFTWREAVVAASLFLITGAAAFGSHVLHGGFLFDDWALLAEARLAPSFDRVIEIFRAGGGNRILNVYYVALVDRTLGMHLFPTLALVAFLAVLMSFSLYLLLRNLRVARLHAAAIAILTLLFPAAAASRFWITAAPPQLAISLYLLGVVVALRGLRARGIAAVLLHAAAVAMYVSSLLMYEICGAAVVAAVLLYRLRAPWRQALVRWPFDVAAAALTLAYIGSSRVHQVLPLRDQIAHARLIASRSRSLLMSLGIPNGAPRLSSLVVCSLLALALVVWFASARDSPVRKELRYWLVFVVAGVMTVAVGYANFVPANPYYSPLVPGVAGRVNILAAAGYVMVLYALLMLAATLAFQSLRHGPQLAAVIAIIGTVFLGVVYLEHLRTAGNDYDRTAELERSIVHVLRDNVQAPPHGTTMYAFRTPVDLAPGVPLFEVPWDLTGAIQLLWSDLSLNAVPDKTLTSISCRPLGVLASSQAPQSPARYGKSLFVDLGTGRSVLIRSRAECKRMLPTFTTLPENPPS